MSLKILPDDITHFLKENGQYEEVIDSILMKILNWDQEDIKKYRAVAKEDNCNFEEDSYEFFKEWENAKTIGFFSA